MDDIHHRRLALLFALMADLQRSALWMAFVFLDDGGESDKRGRSRRSRDQQPPKKHDVDDVEDLSPPPPPSRWPWAHCSYTVQCWRQFFYFFFIFLCFIFREKMVERWLSFCLFELSDNLFLLCFQQQQQQQQQEEEIFSSFFYFFRIWLVVGAFAKLFCCLLISQFD